MKSKKAKMYEQIRKHGEQLNAIFGTNHDPIELCKKLRRIEACLGNAAVNYCNGTMPDEEIDSLESKKLSNVRKLLGNKYPIFFNRDPRGYALKISSDIVKDNNLSILTDWGGYGLIAPEFNGE